MTAQADSIRRAILAEMDRRGWSQSELGRRAGIAQQQIQRYLSGKREARTDTVERILATLRLKISRT